MPRKDLRATPAYPGEVASPQSLTFYVGDPPRQMQIFSGIAIPSWDSQKLLDFEDVFVHFNVPAPQGTYPDDWEYTATISLASIDADGDEDFTFTTDECSVLAHETTGELMLQAKIGVLGSPAHLNRFSYHVEVLSKIPVQTAVSGNIRWNHFYGDPTQAVLNGYSMFLVGPATFRAGGGLGGGGGAAGWTWDAQFTVYTSVPPQRAGDFWVVPYNITGLPLNQHLDIMPNLMPGALNGPSGGFNPMPLFTPPSYPITLTPSTPSRTGLDYEMTFAPLG